MSLISYHYPSASDNPYQFLMFRSLRNRAVSALRIDGGGLRPLLKVATQGSGDILHLHWIHGPAMFKSGFGAILRMAVFHTALLIWRLRGKKTVWTVHNLVNHERRRAWLDRLNSIIVARLSHCLLVHGESARSLVAEQFRVNGSKIHVIYHGNYEGIVRSRSLDTGHEGVRLLFFGMIRPYKGVPELIRAFRKISGPHRLHIAGQVNSDDLKREIESASANDNRISYEMEFIPDEALERLLAWSDVVVLPFRDVLTSGSLLMALTAGRPVVAPRAGLIPEYADDDSAFFYEPSEADGLSRALETAVSAANLPDKASAAREQSMKFRWEDIGVQLARIYQEMSQDSPNSTKGADAAK